MLHIFLVISPHYFSLCVSIWIISIDIFSDPHVVTKNNNTDFPPPKKYSISFKGWQPSLNRPVQDSIVRGCCILWGLHKTQFLLLKLVDWRGGNEDWHSYTRYLHLPQDFSLARHCLYFTSLSLIFCYTSKKILQIPAIKPNSEVLEQLFFF